MKEGLSQLIKGTNSLLTMVRLESVTSCAAARLGREGCGCGYATAQRASHKLTH